MFVRRTGFERQRLTIALNRIFSSMRLAMRADSVMGVLADPHLEVESGAGPEDKGRKVLLLQGSAIVRALLSCVSAATWRTTAPSGISGALDVESVRDASGGFDKGPGISEGGIFSLSVLGRRGPRARLSLGQQTNEDKSQATECCGAYEQSHKAAPHTRSSH